MSTMTTATTPTIRVAEFDKGRAIVIIGHDGNDYAVLPLAKVPGGHPIADLLPAEECFATTAGPALVLGPAGVSPFDGRSLPRPVYTIDTAVSLTRQWRAEQLAQERQRQADAEAIRRAADLEIDRQRQADPLHRIALLEARVTELEHRVIDLESRP